MRSEIIYIDGNSCVHGLPVGLSQWFKDGWDLVSITPSGGNSFLVVLRQSPSCKDD
jgi:hypothetical protein